MKQIRIGIVGMGRMGITHCAILRADPRVRVSSVADTSALVRGTFGKHLGLDSFRSFHDLIAQDKPDAVVVATPPHLHSRVASTALSHDIHTFVEKPFTASVEAARLLVDACSKRPVINQVGYVNRFNDVFRAARELVHAGVIGEVQECHSTMLSATVLQKRGGGWRGTMATGGGVIYEMASHAIDLMTFLVGPFRSVREVRKERIFSESVDDAVQATLEGVNGCKGFLRANWSDDTVRKPVNLVELIGERGTIEANQHTMRVFVPKETAGFALKPGWNVFEITDLFRPVHYYLRGNEFTNQMVHFVDCIVQGKAQTDCSFRDGFETLQLLQLLAEA